MVHRGPDSHGIVTKGQATLGSQRLAIFDPANGRQPMATPDGRHAIVFNGAIYNFRQLKEELGGLGWSFRTACDTEVLLAAFVQWKEACLPRLRGMFAFAVWDVTESALTIVRGPFGIKPLYYHWRTDGSLFFASEIRSLIASRGVAAEIDPGSVGAYLAHFSVPAPETIYRHIRCLRAGELAVWRQGRLAVRSYYSLGAATGAGNGDRPLSYPEFTGRLREHLDDSVRAHSIADVPVGAFLSGGLDSSTIVALLRRHVPGRLQTFTLTFEEQEFSEQASARAIARLFGTEHHEHLLTGEEVARSLPSIISKMDQPTGDGINTYFVSKLAAENGAKVILTGLGGDEIFGGYPSFRQVPAMARFLPYWRSLPAPVRRGLLRLLELRSSVRSRKLFDFLSNARDLHELASLQRMVFADRARLRLLEPGTRRTVQRLGPFHPMLDDFAFELHQVGPLRSVCAWELRTYLTNVLLADSDVFSMANSIELRTPYIDTSLIGWLWMQPEEYVFSPGRYKRALSDATSDLLPATTRGQTKVGFLLPFAVWMRGPLRDFLEESFSKPSLESCPWLEPDAVQELWTDYQSSKDTRNWSRVWSLAILIAFVKAGAHR
jgi:asparagine synthase (glutamine-hydrolysing)